MFVVQVFRRKSVTERFDCVGAYSYERKWDAIKTASITAKAIAFHDPDLWCVEVLDAEGREVYRKGFNVWDSFRRVGFNVRGE